MLPPAGPFPLERRVRAQVEMTAFFLRYLAGDTSAAATPVRPLSPGPDSR
ncbi:MAG TPA: hypothetical protein VFF12_08625 [Myxococcaceae bacterium]|nr:hypothetical protein [Myxococcaceae bacterium]